MADSKITQLAQLAATPDVGDQIELVDVSDTSMAASGTNKRLAASYLARSDAGAKLITGNGRELTVPATGIAALSTSGSWTPELRFGGATTGITYTSRVGYYRRTGDLVAIQGVFILSSKGSASGFGQIFGLPFASVYGAGGPYGIVSCLWNAMSSNLVYMAGNLYNSQIDLLLLTTAATGWTISADTHFGNATELRFSASYFAA